MKKLLIIGILFLFCQYSFGSEWIKTGSLNPSPDKVRLVSSDIETTVIKFTLDGFYKVPVQTPQGHSHIISINDGVPVLLSGAPDVPKITTSIVIPDKAEMGCTVIFSKYEEYQNIDIAPSKGSFSRKIDPASIPYTYGNAYENDEFFPGRLSDLNTPYIMRDYRGQTVNFYPVQYNPVTKTLRVYNEIIVEVSTISKNGANPFYRTKEFTSIDPEFKQIYSRRFINYNSIKYTPVDEEGCMLIISYGSFISTMQPFVEWKKLKGIHTEIVNVSDIGNSSAIASYISNYYNSNNLKYVLLVGDNSEVPSSSSSGDASDNKYGCISGNDSYVEVFVGRFSGSTAAQIETQVVRTIRYEKEMTGTETYLNKGLGLASGDENDDVNAINSIIADMEAYTYPNVDMISSSGSGTQVTNLINQGLGFIPHSGHGNTTTLGSVGFSTSNCNNLTNTEMWPFMYCLACDVGNFTSATCLAEAMLRAESNGNPAGFIATHMSVISQPWYEPYAGLHEQVDILTEQYSNNTKWTFGGIAMNGCGKMIDDYPSQGPWVSDTWVIFGDPSVIIFTDNPTAMNISHPVAIGQGATQFDVTCDMEGALISLTVDGEIIGTAYSNGGSTDITINPPLSTSLPTMQVTVTAKNRIPYMEDVTIGSLNEPYYTITYDNITDDDDASGTLDPGENANINVTVKNMGIDATAPATITASCADITINNSSQNLGTLLSNSTENVSFNADIPSSIPGGTVITVTFNLTDGTYSATELVKEFIVGIDMTGYFTLDFEGLVDYSTDFTPWRSYEGDGQSSWQSSDCDFPGEGGAFGFMAFNPSDAGFGLASAHSGVRVGLAICPSDDVTAADDWTMSPKVPLGTNSSVSFWVLSPKPGTWGNNSYNVLVSTTDDDPSSFTAIASDEEAPDTWTERTYDLSAYDNQDIHIGIQDVSISRFMLWIDDISINTSTVNTEELSAKDQISVFPNPASGHVNINLGDVEINDIKVSVFDMAGKLLKTDYVFIDGNRICMDMSSFTNGIYYINVKTIKQSYTKKITILK